MAMQAWTSLWTPLSKHKGWVDKIEDADKVRQAFQLETNLSFVCRRKSANFGRQSASTCISKCRIRFCDINDAIVPYDGMPFVIVGHYELNCMFGTDQNKSTKERGQMARDIAFKSDHPRGRKSRHMLQTTKKRGCPARIIMKHVFRFPDFQIASDTERSRRAASESLRDTLGSGVSHVTEERIYISLPDDHAHKKTHYLGELTGLVNPISKEVREKIAELVGQGVTCVKEMKRHIRVYVETLDFECAVSPLKTDAAYYPSDETIRKHIYLSLQKLRYSMLDLENVEGHIKEWQKQHPGDNFAFVSTPDVPSSDEARSDESSFFFCHQTQFQRHLLRRYGNSLCLLDATYRTTKYALPLFFLAVKTNVGFSVVAQFVVQEETAEAIKHGLTTIQKWVDEDPNKAPENWSWRPRFFMTDFCEREIKAIEDTFPDCETYLCDFHREQSWTRWVSKHDNGVSGIKDKVLAMLRRCAHANTDAEYSGAITQLKNSEEWKTSPKLRNWFGKTWIPEAKRWVWFYRHRKGLQVNTNNGLESQNKVFKYSFLENKKSSSLSSMIETLMTEFLPSMMLKYIKDNTACSEGLGRLYNKEIPQYLWNRPPDFVKSCLTKIELAETIPEHDIVRISPDTFEVKSQSHGGRYTVCLNTGNGLPNCQCHSWTWTHMPCKHMFALLFHFEELSWHSFPKEFTESPLFTLDEGITLYVERGRVQIEENGEKVDNGQAKTNIEFPSRKRRPISELKSAAVVCREQLSVLDKATYLCTDVEALQHLSTLLKGANSYINSHLYKEDGVPVCPELPLPKKKKKCRPLTKNMYRKSKRTTPAIRRSKSRASGRVGAAADRLRKGVSVSSEGAADEEVIVDGCAEVPGQSQFLNWLELLSKANAFKDSLSPEAWSTFLEKAETTKSWTADTVSLTAMSVLDELSDDDQMELMKSLGSLAPHHFGNSARCRAAVLLLAELVEHDEALNKYDAKVLVQQGQKAMHDLLKATAEMVDAEVPPRKKRVTFSDGSCPGEDMKSVTSKQISGQKNEQNACKNNLPGERKTSRSSRSNIRDKLTAHIDTRPTTERGKLQLGAGSRFHVCGEILDQVDFTSLQNTNWVNDKVINAYLLLLRSEKNKQNQGHIYVLPSYIAVLWDSGRFDTFLYQKVKLSLYEWIFTPVNVNNSHWVLIAGHVPTKSVSLLDSMPNKTTSRVWLNKWRKFMSIRARKVGELGTWRVDDTLTSAYQTDGHSCGPYVMLNALGLTEGIGAEVATLDNHFPALMRNYVAHQLREAAVEPPSQRTTCDMIGCPSLSGHQMWVRCDVCGRWAHFPCVAIRQKPKHDFLCPICIAQYE